MYKEKLVSVIVPIYNVEDYLHECIRSILNQTFQDFELILVDDGATDSSGEICDYYQSNYPGKVFVIHKANGGLSAARNTGIRRARGKYIALIDADDYICPEMLEVLVSLILEQDADIAACKYSSVKKHNEFPSSTNQEIRVLSGDELIYGVYTATCPKIDFVAWNKLYKKELFEKYKIFYPVGKYHEDEYTTPRLLHVCKKVVITNQKLYCYRLRENSIVNTPNSKKTFDYIEALEETMLEYKENEKLAACSLFRYMAVLYMNRKKFRLKTKERFLINKKLNQYIRLVINQKKLSFKRRWGLVAVAFLARIELIAMKKTTNCLK